MGDIEEMNRLLGEARDDLVVTSVMEYCDILEAMDKASQKITEVMAKLENVKEGASPHARKAKLNWDELEREATAGEPEKREKCHQCGGEGSQPAVGRVICDKCKGSGLEPPSEEPKIPSDEFFDDAKRHEMELMGGAPEHLFDRAVPSIQKMIAESKEPEKEGKTFSEPCPECNTSVPYGPGTDHENHPTKCPNCGASIEEKWVNSNGIPIGDEEWE